MSRRNREIFHQSQQEAIESQEHVLQSDDLPQSQQDGEDLIQDAQRDYEEIDELDHYQNQGVDSQVIALNPEARRKAEKDLDKRDRIFYEDEIDDLIEDEDDPEVQLMKRRRYYQQHEDYAQLDDRRYIDVQQCKGKLCEWIEQQQTKRYIKVKFQRFLRQYYDKDAYQKTLLINLDAKPVRIYNNKLFQMLHQNKSSLDISYNHLKLATPTLAIWLGLEPAHLIPELNAILYNTLCKISPQFKNIVKESYVKFYQLPLLDKIPELKAVNLNKLVKVRGVVTSRSQIFSQLKKAVYKCFRCGELKGPYFLHDRQAVQHGACRSCQSAGPFILQKMRSVYRNFQRLIIQQSPSQVMPGRIPRTKEVITVGDNVDITKPGEDIEVIGIYMLRYQVSINVSQGFPVFYSFIEANSIKKYQDVGDFSKIQESTFQNLAKRPEISQIIYNSIAPSIYGHDEVKQALVFALFGGNEKDMKDKAHRIRGDINVLLLGDPGVSKSQFLKSLQKIAPRSIYATGKGASAVGLTATVKQDIHTGQWRLEAGAMVLADKGLCLIDQFDKMNEHDRTSIHEAMEQQTISISKAGIVAQLRARCSVVAAANPIQGQYNQQLNFADNVSLSEPILSRFDIVKVMKDRPNQTIDYDLATFLIDSHMRSHPYHKDYEIEVQGGYLRGKQKQFQTIDQQVLKQYIKYAKQKFKRVQITQQCANMIKQIYVKLRQSSVTAGGINITPRHLESAIRICQAHAKMHLRQETKREDAEMAIRTMMKSFIQTQKHGTAQKFLKDFRYYL